MTTIDPRQRLSAALQAQVAALRVRTPVPMAAGRAAPAPAAAATSGAAMAARLRAIDPDAPDAHQQAVGIYLESELARVFGADLLNDPQFPQLLLSIQQQMQQDAALAAAVEAAGALLLASPAP